jgi:hypothetical protein
MRLINAGHTTRHRQLPFSGVESDQPVGNVRSRRTLRTRVFEGGDASVPHGRVKQRCRRSSRPVSWLCWKVPTNTRTRTFQMPKILPFRLGLAHAKKTPSNAGPQRGCQEVRSIGAIGTHAALWRLRGPQFEPGPVRAIPAPNTLSRSRTAERHRRPRFAGGPAIMFACGQSLFKAARLGCPEPNPR